MIKLITEKEKSFFMEQGYLVVEGLLDGQFLLKLTAAFDEVWENEKPPINQHKLLKNKTFRELIEPPVSE